MYCIHPLELEINQKKDTQTVNRLMNKIKDQQPDHQEFQLLR